MLFLGLSGYGGRMSLKSEISISNIKENTLGSGGDVWEHMKSPVSWNAYFLPGNSLLIHKNLSSVHLQPDIQRQIIYYSGNYPSAEF